MDSIKSVQRHRRHTGMSYKFQRLREKIRRAVESGEFVGKLPGERELARRFRVNAKTLSKALTDLAAEGLLHRSIGRGTFVKGADGQGESAAGPWLLIVDADTDQNMIQHLQALNPQAQVSDDVANLRPSYLNQFNAVIDLAAQTPEPLLRDLLVRNISIVAAEREPRTYSTSAVLLDVPLGVAHLTRELILAGHRRFLAIEGRDGDTIANEIRRRAPRYCSDFSVDVCCPGDVPCAVEQGATACICGSADAASQTLRVLEDAAITVPQQISVAAVGYGEELPCTGYFVPGHQRAAAVDDILRHGQAGRPTTLWLSGILLDRGTTAPLHFSLNAAESSLRVTALIA
jgi:DNA-binding transcriptional regulator YhcF (GntR family)